MFYVNINMHKKNSMHYERIIKKVGMLTILIVFTVCYYSNS
ncbi:hypothetical protein HMPREF9449_00010 [Odoribacter laneus YIT 12061]|uniref:Uncharacterized protein n=1 Tax=Odoribacter laneus YIT 12061 TaxID=742817 RepID=H1DD32_9BACT|nr:hypothetical protein HMPREF9449_00010 [Odoribacter laneus YIT 12061]